MKRIVSILLFVLGSLLATAQHAVGEKAEDISLPGVNGKAVALSSLKGKVVLIDFWASWCKPCRRSFPELKSTYNTYKKKGFEIYGVSLDTDPNDWKTAVATDKLGWLHVNDNNGDIAVKWDVNYIPNSFLLDKEGKIIAVNPTHDQLNTFLKKLL